MEYYYFDIETTGTKFIGSPSLDSDKIILIYLRKITWRGKSLERIQFRIWDYSNDESKLLEDFRDWIYQRFKKKIKICFIGLNLLFDYLFIATRLEYHNIMDGMQFLYDAYDGIFSLDLKNILVVLNDFKFIGYNCVISSLAKVKARNINIPKLYEKGKYEEIERYAEEEAEVVLNFYRTLYGKIPKFKQYLLEDIQ